MPGIVAVGFAVHAFRPDVHDDDFVGRISGTVRNVIDMDLASTLGLKLDKATVFVDSGFVYIPYGATIYGLILFWIFVSFYPAEQTPNQKRLCYTVSLFMFFNPITGSTSIFAIKTAGLGMAADQLLEVGRKQSRKNGGNPPSFSSRRK